MTNTKTPTNKIPLVPGDVCHFVRSGMNVQTKVGDWTGASTITSVRGQNFVVTADIIEASKDRHGNSWLELVDDPEAQKRRWSHGPYFARGPAPADMSHWEPFSIEATLEFEARRQVLYDSVRDPDELALKLRELQRSPLGKSLPTAKNSTAYDREAPKNGRAATWGEE
jgi:hypothetical protein